MRRVSGVLIVGLLAGAGGCNKPASLKTYPVTGTVTYNGKPVSGATVSYVSSNPDAPAANGITESDGRFSLSTYVKPTEVLKGAVPGDYKVTVAKATSAASASTSPGAYVENMTPQERSEQMAKMWEHKKERPGAAASGAEATRPKAEIPERYSNVKTTDLNATVVVGENDPREFKLTDE